MSSLSIKTSAGGTELSLTARIDAPRQAVYRCWTEPELLKRWFVPKPWSTARAELDVRPGGRCLVVMRDPEGKDYPNPGVYLEVVENERLVTTDAFTEAWRPSEKPFMTLIVSFEDEAGQDGMTATRYTARVRHWSEADRKAHEEMGFHEGWKTCTQQLAEVAAQLWEEGAHE